MVEETKEADTTTGQATHKISRGIHDKVTFIGWFIALMHGLQACFDTLSKLWWFRITLFIS